MSIIRNSWSRLLDFRRIIRYHRSGGSRRKRVGPGGFLHPASVAAEVLVFCEGVFYQC